MIISKAIFGPLLYSLTTEEINQTTWALTGPLNILSGVSGLLGALVAGIGISLYAGAKGSIVWKIGTGLFVVLMIALVATALNFYSAPVFRIGGSLILLSFIGILLMWAKERMILKDSSIISADFRLVGYVFMLMATWILCGKAAQDFMKGLEELPVTSMMNVLILLTMGWVFPFLSHYKSLLEQG